jgi:WD domain, G-beta repeat
VNGSIAPDAPYRGLEPFLEKDGAFFFGRDRECDTVVANLLGAKLTVLYGASGVGKSSLLRAGVAHRLRMQASHALSIETVPELAVVVFSQWADDPLGALRDRIAASVKDAWSGARNGTFPGAPSLSDTLERSAQAVGGVVLIILDQFEEHLLAAPSVERAAFDEQLAAAINASDLRAHFLISLQEEFLARLDRFGGRIPRPFRNSLRLEHLDHLALREAIVEPVGAWNRARRVSGSEAYAVESALVEELVRQRAIGVMEQADRPDSSWSDYEPAPIETAYLQLVMRRVWDEELRLKSRLLRYSTLVGKLGGSKQIVKDHLDQTLATMPARQQSSAAVLLRFLVTPAGYKARPSVVDLVEYTGLPRNEVDQTLRYLTTPDVRILRRVTGFDTERYEVFHDVLIPAVATWWQRENLARERRKSRGLMTGLAALIVLFVVAVFFTLWAFRQYDRANEEQARAVRQERMAAAGRLAVRAFQLREQQLDLSLLLSIHAYDLGYSDAESPLRSTLNAVPGLTAILGRMPNEVVSIMPGLAGRQLTAAIHGRTVSLWWMDGRRVSSRDVVKDWEPITSLAFSSDGHTMATASVDGAIRLWSVGNGTLPSVAFPLMGARMVSLALSADGHLLALGGSDGTVRLWSVDERKWLPDLQLRHNGSVQVVAFNTNGTSLATGAADGTVIFWEISPDGGITGTLLEGPGAAVSSIAFGPAEFILAVGKLDGTVRVWRGASRTRFTDNLDAGSPVRGVAIASDGQMIATASDDGSLRLWTAFGGVLLAGPISVHKTGMRSIAFTPDAAGLLTGQEDGSLALWSVEALLNGRVEPVGVLADSTLRDRACQIANRDLSREEWRQFIGDIPYQPTCKATIVGGLQP